MRSALKCAEMLWQISRDFCLWCIQGAHGSKEEPIITHYYWACVSGLLRAVNDESPSVQLRLTAVIYSYSLTLQEEELQTLMPCSIKNVKNLLVSASQM